MSWKPRTMPFLALYRRALRVAAAPSQLSAPRPRDACTKGSRGHDGPRRVTLHLAPKVPSAVGRGRLIDAPRAGT